MDENLRLLETRLDVEIRRRGDSFRVTGAQAESAEDTLRELFDLAKNEEVTPERVHLTLQERESGRSSATRNNMTTRYEFRGVAYARVVLTSGSILLISENGI